MLALFNFGQDILRGVPEDELDANARKHCNFGILVFEMILFLSIH
jgi:hypothetical protein